MADGDRDTGSHRLAALLDGLDSWGLTEVIQLQNEISRIVQQRFGRVLALAFTDVVGSTAYFQRFGDEAGRRLLQRNHDCVAVAIAARQGRIVDTAGDGVFSCFPRAELAAAALIDLQERIARDNTGYAHDHQLAVRAGLHFGPVLTDGVIVTGDSVNLSARVAGLAQGGEIRITKAVLLELPGTLRVRCTSPRSGELKGIADEIETYSLEWRDWTRFPRSVTIEETKTQIVLPDRDLIRFGRLAEIDGARANDVILRLPDEALTKRLSRWHFELRRLPDGLRLRVISSQPTEVNGELVAPPGDVPVGPGSVVRLSGVMTIRFSSASPLPDGGEDTLFTSTT